MVVIDSEIIDKLLKFEPKIIDKIMDFELNVFKPTLEKEYQRGFTKGYNKCLDDWGIPISRKEKGKTKQVFIKFEL